MAKMPTPGFAVFSSAKAGASAFAECLHFEVKSKIDVLAWECDSDYYEQDPHIRVNPSSVKSSVQGAM